MLYALSEKIKRMSSAKPLLLLALFFIIVYLLVNGQPFGVAEFNERYCGLTPLDLQDNYTTEEVCTFMEKLGESGRLFYARMILMLDFAFPLSYMLFWSAALSFLFRRFLPCSSKLTYISLLPFVAGIADYLENILILSMLFSYPKIINMVVVLSNFMTNIKDLFMWVSLLLLLFGLLLHLVRLVVKVISR
ncbi:MAG: hypothetical protein APF77_12775 [Clostridia bacterium BRH_c25]|nr:MAG: hypothetical protein APF77_12775 [Clostridia bacterium BRH_c25]